MYMLWRSFGQIEIIHLQGDGTIKATVVVQSNNLGIPGLVTSMDKIYEV